MPVPLVRHVSACTFDVVAARLVRPKAGVLAGSERCVAHCLVLEMATGDLVLVDVGLGAREVQEPRRIPAPVRFELRPRLDRGATLAAQLQARGRSPGEVRHVVFTHLDLDHAAGLADFPAAIAHVLDGELQHALGVRRLPQRLRYAREPCSGTVRGGVAVRQANGWLLHAGDAYLHRHELEPGVGPGLHQRLVETDGEGRRRSVDRLRVARADGWDVFCSHDRVEFARRAGA